MIEKTLYQYDENNICNGVFTDTFESEADFQKKWHERNSTATTYNLIKLTTVAPYPDADKHPSDLNHYVFDPDKQTWSKITIDYRGRTVYNKINKVPSIVDYPGPIRDTHTIAPIPIPIFKAYYIFDELAQGWKFDETFHENITEFVIKLINEKTAQDIKNDTVTFTGKKGTITVHTDKENQDRYTQLVLLANLDMDIVKFPLQIYDKREQLELQDKEELIELAKLITESVHARLTEGFVLRETMYQKTMDELAQVYWSLTSAEF